MNSNEADAVMASFLAVRVGRCYCDRELRAAASQRGMTCECGRKWRRIGGNSQCSWQQWCQVYKNGNRTFRRGRSPLITIWNAGTPDERVEYS